jgi:hypothetical protein
MAATGKNELLLADKVQLYGLQDFAGRVVLDQRDGFRSFKARGRSG